MGQSCTVYEGVCVCVWSKGQPWGQVVRVRVRCCSVKRGTGVTAPPAGEI